MIQKAKTEKQDYMKSKICREKEAFDRLRDIYNMGEIFLNYTSDRKLVFTFYRELKQFNRNNKKPQVIQFKTRKWSE